MTTIHSLSGEPAVDFPNEALERLDYFKARIGSKRHMRDEPVSVESIAHLRLLLDPPDTFTLDQSQLYDMASYYLAPHICDQMAAWLARQMAGKTVDQLEQLTSLSAPWLAHALTCIPSRIVGQLRAAGLDAVSEISEDDVSRAHLALLEGEGTADERLAVTLALRSWIIRDYEASLVQSPLVEAATTMKSGVIHAVGAPGCGKTYTAVQISKARPQAIYIAATNRLKEAFNAAAGGSPGRTASSLLL